MIFTYCNFCSNKAGWLSIPSDNVGTCLLPQNRLLHLHAYRRTNTTTLIAITIVHMYSLPYVFSAIIWMKSKYKTHIIISLSLSLLYI